MDTLLFDALVLLIVYRTHVSYIEDQLSVCFTTQDKLVNQTELLRTLFQFVYCRDANAQPVHLIALWDPPAPVKVL